LKLINSTINIRAWHPENLPHAARAVLVAVRKKTYATVCSTLPCNCLRATA
jgi:hypothetical protein